jgi:hypothetical protein
MSFWSAKLESRTGEMLKRVESRAKGIGVAIITTLCNAGPKRSGNENYKILAIQRYLYKREPTFLSTDERRDIRKMIRAAFRRPRRKSGVAPVNQPGGLRRLADAIGQKMVRLYRLHIAGGVSKSGVMKGLEASTRQAKVRKGTISNPIMVDSGEVRDSLTYRVDLKN